MEEFDTLSSSPHLNPKLLNGPRRRKPFIRAPSKVCQHWRNLIDGCSHLWITVICPTPSDTTMSFKNALRGFEKRPSDLEILIFTYFNEAPQFADAVVDFMTTEVIPLAQHIRKLVIRDFVHASTGLRIIGRLHSITVLPRLCVLSLFLPGQQWYFKPTLLLSYYAGFEVSIPFWRIDCSQYRRLLSWPLSNSPVPDSIVQSDARNTDSFLQHTSAFPIGWFFLVFRWLGVQRNSPRIACFTACRAIRLFFYLRDSTFEAFNFS